MMAITPTIPKRRQNWAPDGPLPWLNMQKGQRKKIFRCPFMLSYLKICSCMPLLAICKSVNPLRRNGFSHSPSYARRSGHRRSGGFAPSRGKQKSLENQAFSDFRFSKIACAVLYVRHNSGDKIKYNSTFRKVKGRSLPLTFPPSCRPACRSWFFLYLSAPWRSLR